MPIASFKCVRECSSEDAVHRAENLMQLGKKWKTKNVGEKSAYVILELENPQRITGIDLGNEHSAFIEVLVSRGGCSVEDFTDILITCSFMTPSESRNSTEINRVRCFGTDALVKDIVDEKWRQIKVVCTQPFNKHVQYGLSFIKVYVDASKPKAAVEKSLVPEKFLLRKTSTESAVENGSSTLKSKCKTLGMFKLREDSPDSESESSAALFSRWKNTRPSMSDEISAAASIRNADNSKSVNASTVRQRVERPASTASQNCAKDEVPVILDRNRDSLLFGNDDDVIDLDDNRQAKLSKQIDLERDRLKKASGNLKKPSRKSIENINNAEQKQTSKQHQHKESKCKEDDNLNDTLCKKEHTNAKSNSEDKPSCSNSVRNSIGYSKKRLSSPSGARNETTKKSRMAQFRPFNQLLSGVVLVISGIQNPDRADLRSKALALGAKYKTDWQADCTHLICAFKNTPKYNQVKGKGKIVTRSWIEKCYALKKYLPWRRYALDSAEAAKVESDEEILDISQQTKAMNEDDLNDNTKDNTLGLYELDSDCNSTKQNKRSIALDSGSDTDDEIERIQAKNKLNHPKKTVTPNKKANKQKDVYEATTDEEEYVKNQKNNSPMDKSNIFRSAKFFLCDSLSAVDKQKLKQLIPNYNGKITDAINTARYAITKESLKSQDAQQFCGEALSPLWVYECNDMDARVPTKRYLI